MTQADRIRQFAFDRYIVPARTRNEAEIVIRAGDVHREIGLSSAMPAVCSAIGSRKFEEVSGATIVKRTGPTNGANVYFHLSLTAGSQPARPPPPVPTSGESSTRTTDAVDLTQFNRARIVREEQAPISCTSAVSLRLGVSFTRRATSLKPVAQDGSCFPRATEWSRPKPRSRPTIHPQHAECRRTTFVGG